MKKMHFILMECAQIIPFVQIPFNPFPSIIALKITFFYLFKNIYTSNLKKTYFQLPQFR